MSQLPNIITLVNLFFGCCAIVSILNGNYLEGVVFSLGSNVADFLDGAVARMLRVSSPLGKELDSLADMVSFGVVPGLIFYVFLLEIFPGGLVWGLNWYAAPAFLISVMSGYRLAKFNLDTRQTDHFIGMPTPACTLFALGLLLIFIYNPFDLKAMLLQPYLLFLLIPILSWLLVAEIPMFSLKIKNFRWEGNQIRFTFAAIAVLEIIFLKTAALAAIIITYLAISFVLYFLNFHKKPS